MIGLGEETRAEVEAVGVACAKKDQNVRDQKLTFSSTTSFTSTLCATTLHGDGHVDLWRTTHIRDDYKLQDGVSRRRGLLTSRQWALRCNYIRRTK